MKLTKKAKKGFTLVELIVVIAIIAILAAVSVAGYYGFINSANQSAADQEAAQIKTTLMAGTTIAADVNVGTTESPVNLNLQYGKNGIAVTGAEGNVTADNVRKAFASLLAENGVTVITSATEGQARLSFINVAKEAGADATDFADTAKSAGVVTSIVYCSAKNFKSLVSFVA